LLPHELLNKSKRQVRVRIGNVIPYKKLEAFGNDEKLLSYLRLRTYLLKHGSSSVPPKGDLMFQKQEETRNVDPVVSRPDPKLVAEEVKRLPPGQCLFESGNYAVMHAKAHQIPNLLYEIGRLREIAFREVGEGTGRGVDLDRFDLYYTHLFLWNKEKEEVVGGYRLGQVDRILERFGKKGLYTSTLFDYKEGFFRHIDTGIELGRSFVSLRYQKLYSPLLLLWKGIGHFIARNPQYNVLFGPVTVSSAYGELSRQIMVSFLTVNHFAPDVARFVRPRTSLRSLSVRKRDLRLTSGLPADIEELSILISDMEADRKGVPILLRQYVKLGGRLMGFSIDRSFGNGLDGLLLVDLLKCDRKILDRYMGDDGSAAFLNYHEGQPTRDLAS
jgi:putative hemolysin